jgi:hypothetical protein
MKLAASCLSSTVQLVRERTANGRYPNAEVEPRTDDAAICPLTSFPGQVAQARACSDRQGPRHCKMCRLWQVCDLRLAYRSDSKLPM